MDKIKVTISLKEKIWKKYQKYCKENDLIPSYEIQRFMKKEMEAKNGKNKRYI